MARRTLDPTTIVVFGMIRVVPAVVLGGFYLWMAGYIDSNGGRGVDWFGPALFAGLFGVSAIFIIGRTFVKARAAASRPGPADSPPPPSMPDEPSFDAEAAIQRYLASKSPGNPSAGPDSPSSPPPPPPRPTFGKKGA